MSAKTSVKLTNINVRSLILASGSKANGWSPREEEKAADRDDVGEDEMMLS